MNSVNLIGNVTRDIELKHLSSGTAFCEIGLAINERWKVNGEMREKTHFIEVTCWGRTAEVAAEWVKKGQKIAIEGSLDYQSWEDKETGKKRSKIGVKCNRLHPFLSAKSGGNQRDESHGEPSWKETPTEYSSQPSGMPDEEVPF